MSSSQSHLLLWAKTPGKSDLSGYHPLICHLIDASEVSRSLWEDVLTPAVKRFIAAGCTITEPDAKQLVIILTALHDIGKVTPVFQRRDAAGERRLIDNGFRFGRQRDDPGHGRTGAVLLESVFENQFAWELWASRQLALAIGGHHGTFPGDGEFANACSHRFLGSSEWEAARSELINDLLSQFDIEPPVLDATPSHAATMILAGIVSVADWIASDERFFNFASGSDDGVPFGFDLSNYRKRSADMARAALEKLGWLDWSPDEQHLSFAQLFPHLAESPRPAQERITALPGIEDHPGIAILELPMGEGKTEAAFALADHWRSALGQRGTYIAMPTMATANQMFSRASEFLQHRYPAQNLTVQLLHSHAALESGTDAETEEPPPIRPDQTISDDPDESQEASDSRAGEWFTRRKRGLLAPFGVGTVDQVLLASLQTKHVFVRLFGLAGKTVIFDEVHAYDAYMSRLFERLMEWLGALGSSVIILSATLPDSRRRAMIESFARGRSGQAPESIRSADYPRISWLGSDGGMAESVLVSEQSQRELGVEWVDGDPDALGAFLRSKLADGGCAAVICNTVTRAQHIYTALKGYFPDTADDGHSELDLFHARYPFEERMSREQRALVRFGKLGGSVDLNDGVTIPVWRPCRAILVATQVVEQSLDLDFDLMITDHAPIDLILQRSGRLHRHDRGNERPDELSGAPIIRIVSPELHDHVPAFERRDTYIYDGHVLFRSWLALNELEAILVPDDVGLLIESVYDDREPDGNVTPAQAENWLSTAERYRDSLESAEREAEHRRIKSPGYSGLINRIVTDPRAEDTPEIHKAHQALTRLGDQSVSIVCLFGTPDRPTLDPGGNHPISTSSTPTFNEARALVRRAVNIADRRIVRKLLDIEPPSNWQRSPLLRQQRPVVFDAEGQAQDTVPMLRLDPELGLYVEG